MQTGHRIQLPDEVIEYWQAHQKLHPDIAHFKKGQIDELRDGINLIHHGLLLALSFARDAASEDFSS